MSRPRTHEAQFSIRMPEDFVARADRLAEKIAASPMGDALLVTRAAVFRMALARGLESLEAEQNGSGTRRSRGRR